jgi:hypothetical protein
MNHPFFYLSIAALASFYCILFLSLIRDIIRSHYADGSDKTPQKPDPPTNKHKLIIKSVFQAHWINSENSPATPLALYERPLTGLMWTSSLSVN